MVSPQQVRALCFSLSLYRLNQLATQTIAGATPGATCHSAAAVSEATAASIVVSIAGADSRLMAQAHGETTWRTRVTTEDKRQAVAQCAAEIAERRAAFHANNNN